MEGKDDDLEPTIGPLVESRRLSQISTEKRPKHGG